MGGERRRQRKKTRGNSRNLYKDFLKTYIISLTKELPAEYLKVVLCKTGLIHSRRSNNTSMAV